MHRIQTANNKKKKRKEKIVSNRHEIAIKKTLDTAYKRRKKTDGKPWSKLHKTKDN